MKFVMLATLCLFSLNSFSNEKDHKEMDKMFDNMSFEDAKKMKIDMLDKKSSMIEESRRCVTAAKDKTAIRDCMKEMWESKKEMKNEMKDKMKKDR